MIKHAIKVTFGYLVVPTVLFIGVGLSLVAGLSLIGLACYVIATAL